MAVALGHVRIPVEMIPERIGKPHRPVGDEAGEHRTGEDLGH
jgi:hypothetical protein